MRNIKLLQSISNCHMGISSMFSLDQLSGEYLDMIDKVFIPLLEGVGKDSGFVSAVSDRERNALVSFFIDFSERVYDEKSLSQKRRLEAGSIVDKFERHVVSYLCAVSMGKRDIAELARECPAYLDAMKLMMKKDSLVIKEIAETVEHGRREHVLLEKMTERLERERNIVEDIRKEEEYFRKVKENEKTAAGPEK